ncbi:DUF3793 family protein [Clostridium sp. JNZ J1-5]
MCNELAENFISLIDKFDDKDYLLSIIAYNAAPAIAKFKPSYLIIFHNKGKRKLYDFWEEYKDIVKEELNISFYELKSADCSTAVLFYNENQLFNILSQDNHIKFLEKYGYKREMSVKESLSILKERYKITCPHEMGLFLGYPIEDVIEFIEHPNRAALMFGYWKVYHNMESASNTFRKYDEIKMKVIDLIMNGVEPRIIMNNM